MANHLGLNVLSDSDKDSDNRREEIAYIKGKKRDLDRQWAMTTIIITKSNRPMVMKKTDFDSSRKTGEIDTE